MRDVQAAGHIREVGIRVKNGKFSAFYRLIGGAEAAICEPDDLVAVLLSPDVDVDGTPDMIVRSVSLSTDVERASKVVRGFVWQVIDDLAAAPSGTIVMLGPTNRSFHEADLAKMDRYLECAGFDARRLDLSAPHAFIGVKGEPIGGRAKLKKIEGDGELSTALPLQGGGVLQNLLTATLTVEARTDAVAKIPAFILKRSGQQPEMVSAVGKRFSLWAQKPGTLHLTGHYDRVEEVVSDINTFPQGTAVVLMQSPGVGPRNYAAEGLPAVLQRLGVSRPPVVADTDHLLVSGGIGGSAKAVLWHGRRAAQHVLLELDPEDGSLGLGSRKSFRLDVKGSSIPDKERCQIAIDDFSVVEEGDDSCGVHLLRIDPVTGAILFRDRFDPKNDAASFSAHLRDAVGLILVVGIGLDGMSPDFVDALAAFSPAAPQLAQSKGFALLRNADDLALLHMETATEGQIGLTRYISQRPQGVRLTYECKPGAAVPDSLSLNFGLTREAKWDALNEAIIVSLDPRDFTVRSEQRIKITASGHDVTDNEWMAARVQAALATVPVRSLTLVHLPPVLTHHVGNAHVGAIQSEQRMGALSLWRDLREAFGLAPEGGPYAGMPSFAVLGFKMRPGAPALMVTHEGSLHDKNRLYASAQAILEPDPAIFEPEVSVDLVSGATGILRLYSGEERTEDVGVGADSVAVVLFDPGRGTKIESKIFDAAAKQDWHKELVAFIDAVPAGVGVALAAVGVVSVWSEDVDLVADALRTIGATAPWPHAGYEEIPPLDAEPKGISNPRFHLKWHPAKHKHQFKRPDPRDARYDSPREWRRLDGHWRHIGGYAVCGVKGARPGSVPEISPEDCFGQYRLQRIFPVDPAALPALFHRISVTSCGNSHKKGDTGFTINGARFDKAQGLANGMNGVFLNKTLSAINVTPPGEARPGPDGPPTLLKTLNTCLNTLPAGTIVALSKNGSFSRNSEDHLHTSLLPLRSHSSVGVGMDESLAMLGYIGQDASGKRQAIPIAEIYDPRGGTSKLTSWIPADAGRAVQTLSVTAGKPTFGAKEDALLKRNNSSVPYTGSIALTDDPQSLPHIRLPGVHLAVYDFKQPSGTWYYFDWTSQNALPQVIADIPFGALVLVRRIDDALSSPDCFRSLGGSGHFKHVENSCYALIGVKGATPGALPECYNENGPATCSISMPARAVSRALSPHLRRLQGSDSPLGSIWDLLTGLPFWAQIGLVLALVTIFGVLRYEVRRCLDLLGLHHYQPLVEDLEAGTHQLAVAQPFADVPNVMVLPVEPILMRFPAPLEVSRYHSPSPSDHDLSRFLNEVRDWGRHTYEYRYLLLDDLSLDFSAYLKALDLQYFLTALTMREKFYSRIQKFVKPGEKADEYKSWLRYELKDFMIPLFLLIKPESLLAAIESDLTRRGTALAGGATQITLEIDRQPPWIRDILDDPILNRGMNGLTLDLAHPRESAKWLLSILLRYMLIRMVRGNADYDGSPYFNNWKTAWEVALLYGFGPSLQTLYLDFSLLLGNSATVDWPAWIAEMGFGRYRHDGGQYAAPADYLTADFLRAPGRRTQDIKADVAKFLQKEIVTRTGPQMLDLMPFTLDSLQPHVVVDVLNPLPAVRMADFEEKRFLERLENGMLATMLRGKLLAVDDRYRPGKILLRLKTQQVRLAAQKGLFKHFAGVKSIYKRPVQEYTKTRFEVLVDYSYDQTFVAVVVAGESGQLTSREVSAPDFYEWSTLSRPELLFAPIQGADDGIFRPLISYLSTQQIRSIPDNVFERVPTGHRLGYDGSSDRVSPNYNVRNDPWSHVMRHVEGQPDGQLVASAFRPGQWDAAMRSQRNLLLTIDRDPFVRHSSGDWRDHIAAESSFMFRLRNNPHQQEFGRRHFGLPWRDDPDDRSTQFG